MLHSFVLSNLHESYCFPVEFNDFLSYEWDNIYKKILEIERNILSFLNFKNLSDIHKNMAHMVSCNFYPGINKNKLKNTLSLTEHTDISLFTIFPFGTSDGLEYKNSQGSWEKITPSDKVTIFNGHFIKFWSDGKFTACNNRVNLNKQSDKERMSFAFFSITHPEQNIKLMNNYTISAEKYYKDYLGLFS